MTSAQRQWLESELARKRQALEHAREAALRVNAICAEMVREAAMIESELAGEGPTQRPLDAGGLSQRDKLYPNKTSSAVQTSG